MGTLIKQRTVPNFTMQNISKDILTNPLAIP